MKTKPRTPGIGLSGSRCPILGRERAKIKNRKNGEKIMAAPKIYAREGAIPPLHEAAAAHSTTGGSKSSNRS